MHQFWLKRHGFTYTVVVWVCIYCLKVDCMGYIFVADSIYLAAVTLTQLAPKVVVLCENA